MANLTEDITKKRVRKEVVREDIYNRYECTGASGILGEVYIPKDSDALAASETVTLTVV